MGTFFHYSVNLVAAKSSAQKTECLMLCKEIYKKILIHRVLRGDFILTIGETLVRWASK